MALYDFTQQQASFVPPHVVPEGEYKLRIVQVKEDNNSKGNPYWMPLFEIVEDPTAKPVSTYIGLPFAGQDPRQSNNDTDRILKFMASFSLGDLSRPVDPQSWIGKEGWAILKVTMDDIYGEQNEVKSFTSKR